MERPETKTNSVHIQIDRSKSNGNCKQKSTIDTHIKIERSQPNTMLKIVIKSREENKRGREEKRPKTINPK